VDPQGRSAAELEATAGYGVFPLHGGDRVAKEQRSAASRWTLPSAIQQTLLNELRRQNPEAPWPANAQVLSRVLHKSQESLEQNGILMVFKMAGHTRQISISRIPPDPVGLIPWGGRPRPHRTPRSGIPRPRSPLHAMLETAAPGEFRWPASRRSHRNIKPAAK